jgi:hypothetical protein
MSAITTPHPHYLNMNKKIIQEHVDYYCGWIEQGFQVPVTIDACVADLAPKKAKDFITG